ncbi:MAG TPA: DinB family protein [Chloroflexia bacterium]
MPDTPPVTLEAIRGVLQTTPARWQALMAQLPAAILERPAAPGEWSAVDCLRHLIDLETRVFPTRLRALLAGQAFPAAGAPVATAGASPAELAALFARHRTANLDLLAGVQPADLDRAIAHPQLGQVTVRNLVHDWAAHDLMHTVQAERAMLQPFLPGTGPWRHVFADHDLGDSAPDVAPPPSGAVGAGDVAPPPSGAAGAGKEDTRDGGE